MQEFRGKNRTSSTWGTRVSMDRVSTDRVSKDRVSTDRVSKDGS